MTENNNVCFVVGFKSCVYTLFFLLSPCFLWAQAEGLKQDAETPEQWYQPNVDTAMINLYDRTFGLTLFLQQKNIRQNYKSLSGKPHLSYEPNRGTDLGLGFIYRYLALSATYGVIGNVPKDAIKTKNFDFQSQLLFRRAVSFLYAQYYKGFFTDQQSIAAPAGVYARPDMSHIFLGTSTYYGFKKDFAFNGNISPVQWQRQSGGTPFISLDVYFALSRGDSAMIPKAVAADYYYAGMQRQRTWSVGIGAGYAHTFVLGKHFFLTGIAGLKVPVNFSRQTYEDGTIQHEQGSSLTYALWGRAGYNAERWNIALTATNNRNPLGGDFFAPAFAANVGYLRLGYTQRFTIGKKTRKKLKPVDDLLDIPYKLLEQIIP
ncbi:DUF4421 family protein [Edaphocola aurantiacus]|uniref:DUF4421 family protein n=1 Tax=Edaphocola aurantiacus TaxID=2601682 RepID=UPI001C987FD2|nr:DUF4421 family protein [Edaphocola aurantiacus]